MPRVAFLTIALLKAPRADPAVAGFMSRVERNFASAESSPGFVDRSRVDPRTGAYDWGPRGVPRTFPDQNPGDRLVHTLSVWQTLEAIVGYAYSDPHSEAISGRREWCVTPTWPTYVAWWIEDIKLPTWPESYERFDMLHGQGPTAAAFTLRKPFGADGQPCQIARR